MSDFMALGGSGRGARVEVFVDSTQVDSMLERLGIALSPPSITEFLETDANLFFHGRAQERFASEGDDASGRWAPLKQRTQMEREMMGYGPTSPIQVRTGDLEQYLLGDKGEITQSGASTEWTWPRGTTGDTLDEIKYAVAQTGRRRGGGTTPSTQVKRPVVAMNKTDLDEVLFSLETHILDVLSSANAGGVLTLLFGNP